MTKDELRQLEQSVLQIFKNQAPHRTGALKGKIRINELDNGFELISDIEYMPYTTEKWGYNSRWGKTLTNPNEGWWDEAFNLAVQFIGSVTGKEVKRVK